MSKAESSNSSTTAASGTQAPSLPWVQAQNHYMKSTKIKDTCKKEKETFFFAFVSFTLWVWFCFPPEKSQTQVMGRLMICLLGLYFGDVSVMYL